MAFGGLSVCYLLCYSHGHALSIMTVKKLGCHVQPMIMRYLVNRKILVNCFGCKALFFTLFLDTTQIFWYQLGKLHDIECVLCSRSSPLRLTSAVFLSYCPGAVGILSSCLLVQKTAMVPSENRKRRLLDSGVCSLRPCFRIALGSRTLQRCALAHFFRGIAPDAAMHVACSADF